MRPPAGLPPAASSKDGRGESVTASGGPPSLQPSGLPGTEARIRPPKCSGQPRGPAHAEGRQHLVRS